MSFNLLGMENLGGLEVSFTKKEVFVALSRFSGEKALRLDGFTWPIRSIVGIL